MPRKQETHWDVDPITLYPGPFFRCGAACVQYWCFMNPDDTSRDYLACDSSGRLVAYRRHVDAAKAWRKVVKPASYTLFKHSGFAIYRPGEWRARLFDGRFRTPTYYETLSMTDLGEMFSFRKDMRNDRSWFRSLILPLSDRWIGGVRYADETRADWQERRRYLRELGLAERLETVLKRAADYTTFV